MVKWDFSGWATRNDLLCGDGVTIRHNCFKDDDGITVPLIWNHQHNNPDAVVGQALLEHRDEGVYAYGTFNDSENGKLCKKLVRHGDIRSLSINAKVLKKVGMDILHGAIKEVSLVVAGANPGACIMEYNLAHGDDGNDDFTATWDENIMIYHADDEKKGDSEVTDNKEEKKDDKTIQEVIDSMNEEQRNVMNYLVGEALAASDDNEDEEGDEEEMRHNLFDAEDRTPGTIITHADQQTILSMAKQSNIGSLRAAMEIYAAENEIEHSDTIAAASGFNQNTAVEGNITTLFPEYHDVKPGAPELITSDQGWIGKVMAKVHKSPFSRIRTGQVDIRNIEALRAKGYFKGKKKNINGNYQLSRRTTDPQTVYVKSALHRDDVIDITDFDIVSYQYNIDRMMLNEELATAIMLGDDRESGADGKIEEDKIRPIWKDDELYTLHYDIDFEAARNELQGTGTGVSFGENYIKAEAMINTVLYAREKYKGTGTPDMYITPHMLNVMLLARDMNGRRIHSSKAELEAALNVGSIITAEQFEGKTRVTSVEQGSKTKKLVALIVNLADYSLGATKGGEITHFTDFDIDFNQHKSLLETRVSGALTKVWSAMAIEEDVTSTPGSSTETE